MSDILVVDDLVEMVREGIDEANIIDTSDAQILRGLNRAQRRAMRKVVPTYPEMFLTKTGDSGNPSDYTTVANVRTYAMPSNIYGMKVKDVYQIHDDGTETDLRRILSTERSKYTLGTNETTTYLRAYAIEHRNIEIFPEPEGGLTLKVFYTRLAEPLIKSAGRITGSGSTYVDVVQEDSSNTLSDTDLEASDADLNCYVNIIDFRTGKVKATMQISSIDADNNRVNFKTAGLTRATVLGRTVSTSLPSDLGEDDRICTVHGTCISEIPQSNNDFLVQEAITTIKRSKGEPTQEEYSELMDQEEDLKTMYAGNETRRQIKQRKWSRFRRRYWRF
jgi:hypothetical protein